MSLFVFLSSKPKGLKGIEGDFESLSILLILGPNKNKHKNGGERKRLAPLAVSALGA